MGWGCRSGSWTCRDELEMEGWELLGKEMLYGGLGLLHQ